MLSSPATDSDLKDYSESEICWSFSVCASFVADKMKAGPWRITRAEVPALNSNLL